MVDMDKVEQAIADPEFYAKVKGLWAKNAEPSAFVDVFKEAGIEADLTDVEEILRHIAKRRGEEVAFEDIDPDQLGKLAGGWCGFWQSAQGSGDSCSNRFQVEHYKDIEHCFADTACDDMFMDPTGYLCNVQERLR